MSLISYNRIRMNLLGEGEKTQNTHKFYFITYLAFILNYGSSSLDFSSAKTVFEFPKINTVQTIQFQ